MMVDYSSKEKEFETLAVDETSTVSDEENQSFEKSKAFVQIVLALIIVIGTIGNTLNIIVFGRRNMRKGSTFRFLLYLSTCDLLVLLVCATDALSKFGFGFEIRSYSKFTCRLHTFLTYLLIHSSSVILMVISVDRALMVTNTSLMGIICKQKRTQTTPTSSARERETSPPPTGQKSPICRLLKYFSITANSRRMATHRVDIVMFFVFVCLVMLNGHYLAFLNLNIMVDEYETNRSVSLGAAETPGNGSSPALATAQALIFICFPRSDQSYHSFLIEYWTYIDIFVCAFIPFVIMSVCSVIILTKIRRKNQNYFNNLLLNRNSETSRQYVHKRSKKSRQLLYMLLITNLYFFLSQLPYCVTFVLFRGTSHKSIVGQFLVHVLSYTNNAVNFLFYGFSSQKYRQQLIQLLDCCGNKHKNNHLQPTVCNGKEADATMADRNSIYSMSPLYNVRKLSRQFILGSMNKSIQLNDLKSYGSIQPKETH